MGGKACLTEGGIRVPLVFRWKGKIEGGLWSEVAVDCNDIFPTLLEAAGYDPTPYYKSENGIDGRSITGLLQDPENNNKSYQRNTRYWHYPFNVIYNNPYDGLPLTPHSSIMEGDYKLIFDWHGRLKLFNIREDISETDNLAHEMPEKTNELFDRLMKWTDSNVKERYLPYKNGDYQPQNEARDVPYLDLVKAYRDGENVAEIAN